MARPGNPTSWAEYEGRSSSIGSIESNAVEEDAFLDGDEDQEIRALLGQERRRSSVRYRIAAMADIGGVNSLRSFARSWQRAASFAEVLPHHPSFVIAVETNSVGDLGDGSQDIENVAEDHGLPRRRTGLLAEQLTSPNTSGVISDSPQRVMSSSSGHDCSRVSYDAGDQDDQGPLLAGSLSSQASIFAGPHHLTMPHITGSYGSLRRASDLSRMRSRSSFSQGSGWGPGQQHMGADGGEAAFVDGQLGTAKAVKQDEHVIISVHGQSTLPQSIFNSINAIIGVGLLSLPLAFKMSGWIIGLVMLTLNAAVTAHTGKLLGKCMHFDASIISYSDLAYMAFGTRARVIVSALFTLELVAACVALIILFADSLDLLLPSLATPNIWKCICAVLVLVLNMLPLRWLSYTSIVGIFSTFCIVCIAILNGLIKEHAPGSLWEPAKTHLLPSNWLSLPIAYGLMASPWGAHSVFPSIHRDMRHPHKWDRVVNVTFSFSYVLDTCLAIIGILMFGDGIQEAITSNILKTPGYPESLIILMCCFVTVIPLTKIPLNARPLITTADVVCGVGRDRSRCASGSTAQSSHRTRLVRGLARVFVVLVLLGIAILFPAFDSVCAFLGAALCSLVSVILPICFYLKLYHRDITRSECITSWTMLAVFSVFGLVGTIWTFLPRHLVEA